MFTARIPTEIVTSQYFSTAMTSEKSESRAKLSMENKANDAKS